MKRNLLFFLFFLYFLYSMNAQDQCAPVGWATYNGSVTGGGSATAVTVTTIGDLITQAKSSGSKVIYVSGTMGSGTGSRIDVTSNKTIIGMPGATIKGIFVIKGASNVIIRNLKIHGPGAEDVDGVDCMVIESSTRVWIDHCEFQDGQDGNLDIKRKSDYIAITWCKFQYTSLSKNHMFSTLVGHDDGFTDDRGFLRVTMQYNWFADGVIERMPRVRFGKVHVVNNLFTSSAADYCVRAGEEADILVESNAFIGVNSPIDIDASNSKVTEKNNLFTNTSGTRAGQGTSFTPPYTLTVAPAADVQSLVSNASCGAGATLDSPTQCGCSTTPVNKLPAVSITAPATNATYTAPANITLNANATDSDGSISKVEFFNGGTLLFSDASSAYSYNWTGVAAGTYTITAKATDNSGGVTTSSPITIVVNSGGNQSPTVSITAPANNATYLAPASFTINATAADADGTISKVEFFNGLTLLFSDATSAYSYNWTGVAAGTYTITAKATDNSGAVTISSPITVLVNSSVPGQAIQAENFCFAEGAEETEHTGFNGTGYLNLENATGSYATFAVTSSSAQTVSLSIRYASTSANNRNMSLSVNGAMQVASVDFVSTGAWTTYNTVTVQVPLVAGHNLLRLTSLMSEGSPNLDELSFNTNTVSAGNCSGTVNTLPTISITSPTNNSTIHSSSVSISGSAADSDGSITKVEVYNGATLVASSTSSPFNLTWNNPGNGTHAITIKVTDNSGGVTTATRTVTVQTIPSGLFTSNENVFTNIFPNPSADVFQIRSSEAIKSIRVINVHGAIVEEATELDAGKSIDIGRTLEDGTYILMVEYASERIAVGKMVKIK